MGNRPFSVAENCHGIEMINSHRTEEQATTYKMNQSCNHQRNVRCLTLWNKLTLCTRLLL